MEAWDDALLELKRDYLRSCVDRLRRMDLCLGLVDASEAAYETPAGPTSEPFPYPTPRSSSEALAELHHELHSLAGSGAIYGLPEVSRLAGLGERRCLAITERAADAAGDAGSPAGGDLRSADIADLRRTGEALRAEIAVAVAADAPARPPAPAPPPARTGGARVLSIEDDPEQAAYLRTVLESAGYEVRGTTDPATFGEDLAAFRPDLVLMDVLLPGATGYELARRVRQEAARTAIPILFVTTEGQLSTFVESARVGGDDHLVKPVAPELLLAAVATRLSRREALPGTLDHDGLTGLLNQAAFLERARQAVERKARTPRRRTAWVTLDLDHFKAINERFGYPAGDRVLASLGALLGHRLRPADAAARYGGEEFAILLDHLGERDAVRLVDRLREEFQALEHEAPKEAAFRVSFSAGVAFLRPGMGLDEWREAADRVLSRAKARGRNQVALAVAPFPPLPGVEREPAPAVTLG